MGPDIDYHRERAMVELNRALRATSAAAARSHFDLGSLHLHRLEQIGRRIVPDRFAS